MTMHLVIALLVVIVLLLCVPLKHRARLIRTIVEIAAVVLVIYYIGPLIFGLLVYGCHYVSDHLGLMKTLCIVAVAVVLTALFFAWRSDRKENEAIRAGSEEAFNRRVETYKSDLYNYDHERAVEAATRIKEEK